MSKIPSPQKLLKPWQYGKGSAFTSRVPMMSLSLFTLALSYLIGPLIAAASFLLRAYPDSPAWQLSLAKSLVTSAPNALLAIVLVRLSSFIDPDNNFYLQATKWVGRLSLILAGLYLALVRVQLLAAHHLSIRSSNTFEALRAMALPFALYAMVACCGFAFLSPTWGNPKRPFVDLLASFLKKHQNSSRRSRRKREK